MTSEGAEGRVLIPETMLLACGAWRNFEGACFGMAALKGSQIFS